MKKKCYVYTVVSTDDRPDEPINTVIIGTFVSRESAVKACVEYMLWRLKFVPDVRYAFMNDVRHATAEAVSSMSGVPQDELKKIFAYSKDDLEIPENLKGAVISYVKDVVENGDYKIETDVEGSEVGYEMFMIQIQENELVE